ncbi:tetratricopeptide repeat protein [Sulfitobacter sp. HGT1]|jgi:Flp pilus assembly protein TadD|uniref:tetratricopeptide repeat protein n=1 Tax=unclassified Sulfitobacter TaxID=196795 RepID=UPI001592BB97|nr:tetratricopeptide repeat protein [Sulfitobacter sp. HGT1]MBQ0805571.1 tetratricopeptide repeat protein [Sulfitobacter sp.]
MIKHQSLKRLPTLVLCLTITTGLTACSTGGFPAFGVSRTDANPFAPGVNQRKDAEDGVEVAHRLMKAGEYELAIRAFNRAALATELNAEILSGLGSANLGLGRLGQAEKLLREAVAKDDTQPEVWNNLGVVLMERGKLAEANLTFRKAYALDNGESDAIRDNLRLALAKSENSATIPSQEEDYKLVRRGSGDYLLRPVP